MQFPVTSTIPKERAHRVRLLGTGASAPTKELGQGITVTRTGAGVYKLTWADNPGTFVGMDRPMLGGTTPADVKGHDVTRDTYDSSTLSIEVSLWDSSNAADDLQATEYMDLTVRFSELSEIK